MVEAIWFSLRSWPDSNSRQNSSTITARRLVLPGRGRPSAANKDAVMARDGARWPADLVVLGDRGDALVVAKPPDDGRLDGVYRGIFKKRLGWGGGRQSKVITLGGPADAPRLAIDILPARPPGEAAPTRAASRSRLGAVLRPKPTHRANAAAQETRMMVDSTCARGQTRPAQRWTP